MKRLRKAVDAVNTLRADYNLANTIHVYRPTLVWCCANVEIAPTWSCVSLPRPTTSSGWNLLICVWCGSKHLQMLMFYSEYQWFTRIIKQIKKRPQRCAWGVKASSSPRPWIDLLYPKNPRWRWQRAIPPQGPKNVYNFLMTVRPLSWAWGHRTEMLLILKKNIF